MTQQQTIIADISRLEELLCIPIHNRLHENYLSKWSVEELLNRQKELNEYLLTKNKIHDNNLFKL